MNMTEEFVIRQAVKRLKGDDRTSPEVVEMLRDPRMKVWLDTWVIGSLECLLPEQRDLDLARGLAK